MDELILIFRALWYLRLHGLKQASFINKRAFEKLGNKHAVSNSSSSSSSTPRVTTATSTANRSNNTRPSRTGVGTAGRNQTLTGTVSTIKSTEFGRLYHVLPEIISQVGTAQILCFSAHHRFIPHPLTTVISEIQRSGSVVRLAQEDRTGHTVVLKYLLNSDDTELRALQRLRGVPGVVQLLDHAWDSDQSCYVLVLEYLGQSCAVCDVASAAHFRHYFYQLMKVKTVLS